MKKNTSISVKLIFVFICTSIIALSVNVVMFININRVITQVDSVYATNLDLNTLAGSLKSVQDNMYEYLNLKNSEVLEAYYTSEQNYQVLVNQLNDNIQDSEVALLEVNIKEMSASYLEVTGEAVQAKRGRNTSKYNDYYQKASDLYIHINTYINNLNNIQFINNSAYYILLREALQYFEWVSTGVILGVVLCNLIMMVFLTRRITKPLINLAKTANEVAQGNFEITVGEVATNDEVAILSRAFHKMIISIRVYIDRLRESMIVENKMKEKELMMENHLKDAQLKYLQAQINPHFLFNTLNAGVQLAMMENAEKTSIFIENMAEFFRYNITKMNQDTSLKEELQLVEHYIYILNVRFSGEIQYEKNIDENLVKTRVPGMILQPFVENAMQYGIRDIGWRGVITISLYEKDGDVCICIEDNGKGMMQETIDKISKGEVMPNQSSKNSNGIAIGNVMSRLQLYFNREDVLEIRSEGINKGTKVIITIPKEKDKESR